MKSDIIEQTHADVMYEQIRSDGIMQLTGGMALIVYMTGKMFSPKYWLVYIVVMLLSAWLKKHYTYPRIGKVKVRAISNPDPRLWISLIVLTIFILGGFWFLVTHKPQSSQTMIIWGVIFLALAFAMVMLMFFVMWGKKYKAYILYSILMLVLFSSVFWGNNSDMSVYWSIIGVGGVNVIMGTIRLIRFIKTNPVVYDEN